MPYLNIFLFRTLANCLICRNHVLGKTFCNEISFLKRLNFLNILSILSVNFGVCLKTWGLHNPFYPVNFSRIAILIFGAVELSRRRIFCNKALINYNQLID